MTNCVQEAPKELRKIGPLKIRATVVTETQKPAPVQTRVHSGRFAEVDKVLDGILRNDRIRFG